ncbi:hypothetical protein GIB67_025713, partial [Kingdonia uniflora]
ANLRFTLSVPIPDKGGGRRLYSLISFFRFPISDPDSCEMTCFPRSLRLLSSFVVSHSSCSKTYGHSDLESAISHEDEALFG